MKEKRTRFFSNIEKSSNLISGRMAQIEKVIDNYEIESDKKIKAIQTDFDKELDDYRKNIEELKNSGLKIESSVQEIIAGSIQGN